MFSSPLVKKFLDFAVFSDALCGERTARGLYFYLRQITKQGDQKENGIQVAIDKGGKMPHNELKHKVAKCHSLKGANMATLIETSKSKNSDRLNCRISPTIKARAEAAAQVLGQSITAFTETALAEKAQHVLAQQERIVLSEAQFARFVEILDDPSPPTPALQKAMQKYQATKTAHPDRGL